MSFQSTAAFASSINTQFFVPSSGYDYVYSEDALMDSRRGLGLGVTYDYLKNPLVRENAAQTANTSTVISGLHTLDLMATYRLDADWKLGFGLPLNMVSPAGAASQFALGDSRLFAKYQLTFSDDKKTATAIQFETRLPTGNSTYYLSDTSLGVGFRYVLEHDFGFMQLVANAGFMWASNSTVAIENLSYRTRIPLSLSSRIPLGGRWAANIEGNGAIPIPVNSYQNPGEGYAGLQYKIEDDATLFAGGAIGKFGSVGSDDYRIIVGFRAAFNEPKKAPTPAPAPTPVAVIAPAPKPAPKPRVVFTKKEITISEQVNFATGKDIITQSGKDLLDEVAKVIRENMANFKKIRIEGHTDRHGGDAYNMRLSKARALSVRTYLESRGVDSKRLESEGYGKRRPKAPSGLSPTEQDAVNRRVEFKVIN
jgi:outer membrane protein OmpA-like peptidoglycan-associated protein